MAIIAATHQAALIAIEVEGRWSRPVAFPAADAVLDAGVRAVAGFEE